MTLRLSSLSEVAERFDAIVLDQWGVLHDGTCPYPRAVAALERLRARGTRLAVLSNSGKRAAPNLDRIAAMGFAPDLFDSVMTSGEALYQDIAAGRVQPRALFPIERSSHDAQAWASGLAVNLVTDLSHADGVLLMGLPDAADLTAIQTRLDQALALDLPVFCTNPDRASPRADGQLVT
ncbi:MAG: TIGR01459 family HAD-type hydrolase, partial [Rhodobacteraceae bacterium]|nr:TIGR01459 family HAD-type hydrolase [Paracoccaceae bacterium]